MYIWCRWCCYAAGPATAHEPHLLSVDPYIYSHLANNYYMFGSSPITRSCEWVAKVREHTFHRRHAQAKYSHRLVHLSPNVCPAPVFRITQTQTSSLIRLPAPALSCLATTMYVFASDNNTQSCCEMFGWAADAKLECRIRTAKGLSPFYAVMMDDRRLGLRTDCVSHQLRYGII